MRPNPRVQCQYRTREVPEISPRHFKAGMDWPSQGRNPGFACTYAARECGSAIVSASIGWREAGGPGACRTGALRRELCRRTLAALTEMRTGLQIMRATNGGPRHTAARRMYRSP